MFVNLESLDKEPRNISCLHDKISPLACGKDYASPGKTDFRQLPIVGNLKYNRGVKAFTVDIRQILD
jgi:hypothetical protein